MILMVTHQDLSVGLEFTAKDIHQQITINLDDPTRCLIDIKGQYTTDVRILNDANSVSPPYKRGDIVQNFVHPPKPYTKSKGIQCNRFLGARVLPDETFKTATLTFLYPESDF